MSIECGVDDKNLEHTKQTILKEIESMKNGDITDLEIENAKMSIRRLLISIHDRVSTMHSFVSPLYIFDRYIDVDEFLNNINQVTRERIIEVSKTIVKSAIFSIRPMKEVE